MSTENDENNELTESELNELNRAFDALTPEKQDRIMMIRELRRKGLTISAMARLMKVSDRTVVRDLEWMAKHFGRIVDKYNQAESLGAAISLFQEIEDRAMDLATQISTEHEIEMDVLGKRTKVLKQPDHYGARSYYELAARMRKEHLQLMQEVGMLKFIPPRNENTGRP